MILFGIFSPPATGSTAGVNMWGDLKAPNRSTPAGTIAAILVGMAVYVSLAVFFAAKVPQDALVNNGDVLLEVTIYTIDPDRGPEVEALIRAALPHDNTPATA